MWIWEQYFNDSKKEFMVGLPFGFYNSVDAALGAAGRIVGENSKIYVIPHSLATIPRQI